MKPSCHCFDTNLDKSEYIPFNPDVGFLQVSINGPEYKFSAAHFVAYKNFREKLHGHNYTVSVRIGGDLHEDGYVIDFGIVKTKLRQICKEINEHVIIPMKSDVLEISIEGESCHIFSPFDGAKFLFPLTDCKLLPIVHSTSEELAAHIWESLASLLKENSPNRSLHWMEVCVAETAVQEARYIRKMITHA